MNHNFVTLTVSFDTETITMSEFLTLCKKEYDKQIGILPFREFTTKNAKALRDNWDILYKNEIVLERHLLEPTLLFNNILCYTMHVPSVTSIVAKDRKIGSKIFLFLIQKHEEKLLSLKEQIDYFRVITEQIEEPPRKENMSPNLIPRHQVKDFICREILLPKYLSFTEANAFAKSFNKLCNVYLPSQAITYFEKKPSTTIQKNTASYIRKTHLFFNKKHIKPYVEYLYDAILEARKKYPIKS